MSHIAENAVKRYQAATKICAAAMSIIQQYREADGTPPELLVKYLETYVETYAPIFWEELKHAETGYTKVQRRAMQEIEEVRKHSQQHLKPKMPGLVESLDEIMAGHIDGVPQTNYAGGAVDMYNFIARHFGH